MDLHCTSSIPPLTEWVSLNYNKIVKKTMNFDLHSQITIDTKRKLPYNQVKPSQLNDISIKVRFRLFRTLEGTHCRKQSTALTWK